MNPVIFFISETIFLILLILHSYLTKGGRVTVKFFVYALIFMSLKEVILPSISIMAPGITSAPMMLGRHYRFLLKNAPDMLYRLSVVAGWPITFYLSWSFSEKIVSRFSHFKGRLFTILAFGMIITASICYALENFGAAMGLWSWRTWYPKFEPFLMNCPFRGIEGWVHMSLVFLLSFFIIECSKYKSAKWKYLPLLAVLMFFIFPFLDFKKNIVILDLAVISVIFSSFFITMRMECRNAPPSGQASGFLRHINLIPFFVILSILLFMIIWEFFFLRYPPLAISVMPLFVIVLLSIKKLPLPYILLLSSGMAAIMKERAAFSLIPVIFALILWGVDRAMKVKKINILKIIYLITGIIIYLYFSYQAVIFLRNLRVTKYSPRILMSVYKGPAITISGNILFKGYEKGRILIRVIAMQPKEGLMPREDQFEIAQEILAKPGPYEIKIPRRIGKVYITASNIGMEDNAEILPPELLSIIVGEYAGNPLKVSTKNIKGVDIELAAK